MKGSRNDATILSSVTWCRGYLVHIPLFNCKIDSPSRSDFNSFGNGLFYLVFLWNSWCWYIVLDSESVWKGWAYSVNITADLRQKVAFSVLFLMGANLLIGSSYRAEQDTWISMLIASAILILWSLVLSKISCLCPGKDIFDLSKMLPKWIGYPIIGIVTFYCFSQAAITLRVYAGFVHIVSLPNTDILILLALISVTVLFFLSGEDQTLYRFSYMTALPIVFIIFLLFAFLFQMFRLENIFPIFYNNTTDVLYCAAENFAFPFGNAFLLLGLSFYPNNPKKERKTWIWIAIISSVLSLLVVLQNILLLGGKLSDALDFPLNFAASLVNVGDFFSRIEVFSSLFFFLSAIVRSVYLMKLVSRGIRNLIPVETKPIAFPLLLFLCGYSAIAFDNTNSVFNYLQIFPYIALPLQFGFPLILFWICKHRNRKQEQRPGISAANFVRTL